MKLSNLTILSRTNPVGIDRPPYFSYVLTSEKSNVRQVSCHIFVYEGERLIWQKEVEGEQSTFHQFDGTLQSKTRYDVKIEAVDNYGESDTIGGYFETAFLSSAEWGAEWVKSTLPVFQAEKGFGKQPPATMFQKSFCCGGKIAKARLYMTCHGIYRPYLNGERFFGGEFAPEHSTYEKVLFYQTYDVSDALVPGENSLLVYVGDGWYLGVKTMPRIKNYERRHAVLFQLEITYEDGTVQTVCSDQEVCCAYGPVVCSDLFAGEKYDANQKISIWQKGEVADYGYGNLMAQVGEPAMCCGELAVKELLVTPEGDFVLDFGKVVNGRLRAKIEEPKGKRVSFTHTEVLDAKGNWFQNTQMPDGGVEQRDEYISDGTSAVYEPFFTIHGFRYVKVTGITELKAENFTARIYTTRKQDAGSFRCSDERINQLYANIRNSQTGNMLSIPTDCPQREKAGWTGDIGIYARTALLNEDVTSFLERWLLSVRADQGGNGAIPIVVPYDGGYPMSELFFGPMFQETGTIGSAGWGDACVLVPWAMYCITGNTIVIREYLDVMQKWCQYILKRCEMPLEGGKIPAKYDRYLWNGGYHQGDWLVPSLSKEEMADPMESIKIQKFTAQYAAPMYGCHTFDLMAEMMSAIGETQKEKEYWMVAEKMKEAIQNVLFDENGDLPTGLMGAYVLAVAFDLVPEQYMEHVSRKLAALLKENNGKLDTGFLSTPYLLDAFVKIGRRDLAYHLLFQRECPGWLYEVEHGATAIWESWENYQEDGTPKAISFNHYAYGCVDDWIFRNLVGIVPENGFKKFRIQPFVPKGVTYAERTFQSVYGEIYVKWEILGGNFTISCRVPCNTEAEILMPSGMAHSVGSGSYCFAEEGGLEWGNF